MAEEPQDSQNDESEEDNPDQVLDQAAINEMLQQSQASEADNLENLLDSLEVSPEESEGEDASGADEMEAVLENIEGEDESEGTLDDILYQATLADSGGVQDKATKGERPTIEGGDTDEGGTILLVDSDDENINLFRDALSDGDVRFITAPSGEEALSAIQIHDVDLILVNLDQGDGIEIVSELTGQDMPDIPVVVTSEESERIKFALQEGAVDHFSRPIGLIDLELQIILTVKNLIRLRRAERMLAGMPANNTQDDEPTMRTSSEDDLDALLTDDPVSDDDDFGEDDDVPFGDDLSSSLDVDDLLEDDNDEFAESPKAILAGAGKKDSDPNRLTPLSNQGKMAHRMDRYTATKSSSFPKSIGIVTLVLVLAGVSGLATKLVMDMENAGMSQPEAIRPIALPVIKPPTIQQAGYERSRNQARRPSDYEKQADNVKLRIRNSVRELNDPNGAWWSPWRVSPWRVMQSIGGSVNVLVQGRSQQDIVDAFGASRSDVNAALNSSRTVNYLARVGYDVRGKTAADLTPRETFELLSTREIDSADEIVDVLTRLTGPARN